MYGYGMNPYAGAGAMGGYGGYGRNFGGFGMSPLASPCLSPLLSRLVRDAPRPSPRRFFAPRGHGHGGDGGDI